MTAVEATRQFIESLLNYRFQEPQTLVTALRAAGAGLTLAPSPNAHDGNKRLAQVGDAVMRLAVLDEWYITDAGRAVSQQRISTVGSMVHLSFCGQRLELGNHIFTNPSQGREPPSPATIAKTVQALIGAVWIDSGRNMEAVRQSMHMLGL